MRSAATSGLPAALPLAAAATLLVAPWLPLRFEYRENALGIVSLTTLARYVAPVVEEIFKSAVIIYLIARHRVAFLVDAAIIGLSLNANAWTVTGYSKRRSGPDSDDAMKSGQTFSVSGARSDAA